MSKIENKCKDKGVRLTDQRRIIAKVMSDSSICGLGQAASNPLKSVIKYFPEEIKK